MIKAAQLIYAISKKLLSSKGIFSFVSSLSNIGGFKISARMPNIPNTYTKTHETILITSNVLFIKFLILMYTPAG